MLSTRGITEIKRIYLLAKSDRINALRKQYDAFLEEDKKRKERNDFILGRLDKMRYATALVPVRYTPSVFETRPAVVDRLGFKPEFSSIRDFQSSNTNETQLVPEIQVNNNEDTYLIQEISKKYILIPKLRTTFLNNCIRNGTTNENSERLHLNQDAVPIKELKPNEHDNSDWKSKYEILNILKDEEKGKAPGNYQTSFVDPKQSVPKQRPPENNQDQVALDYNNYVDTDAHVDTPKKFINEYPEKDLPADTLEYGLPKDGGYSLNNTERVSESLVSNTDTSDSKNMFVANVKRNKRQADAIGDQLQNITLEYQDSDANNTDISREVADYHEPEPVLDLTMTSMVADDRSKQSVQINEEKFNVEDEYPNVASSLIHDQNESVEQYEPADSEQVVYAGNNEISPLETLNYNSPTTLKVNDHIFENETLAEASINQDFAPNIGVQMKTDATDIPQGQVYLNSNVDTVEEAEPGIEKTENQVNVTESIEDFDAEQREMFYSEQTDDNNYPSQHADEEHPLDYTQNEYSQNQEYAYYENTEAEAYPVELNDEEVTQQYDPSYEQQYTGLDQAAEQQQYAEQYQEPEKFTDQVEPQFEVQQYEQQFESQGDIEETLDIEDGYTTQKSEAPPAADENPTETDKSDDITVPVATGI